MYLYIYPYHIFVLIFIHLYCISNNQSICPHIYLSIPSPWSAAALLRQPAHLPRQQVQAAVVIVVAIAVVFVLVLVVAVAVVFVLVLVVVAGWHTTPAGTGSCCCFC